MTKAKEYIFVFGSNEGGIHGAGAAHYAYKQLGAIWGKSYGHHGKTFAIPTKNEDITETLPLERIRGYVEGFKAYAAGHPKLFFKVTQIGCGLAGLTPAQVAPLFVGSPVNCEFDMAWATHLGDGYNYWGSL